MRAAEPNPSRAVTTPVFCSGAYGNLLASSASVWLNQETRGSMRLAVWFDALIRRCEGLLDLADIVATLRATFGSLRGANRGASDRGGQGQAHIAHTRGVWRQIVPNLRRRRNFDGFDSTRTCILFFQHNVEVYTRTFSV